MTALLNLVSTVRVVLDGWFWKGLAAAWVLLLLGLAVFALRTTRRSPPWRAILLLLSVTVIAQGPVLLMPHLTEANFTRSLGPGLLALALCLQPWWEAARKSLAWRRRLVFLLSLWFVFDVWAIAEKSTDIVHGQLRAARFREQLRGSCPARFPHRCALRWWTRVTRVIVFIVSPFLTISAGVKCRSG